MAVYTAYEPPEPPADRYERAERLEFVREGFNVWAVAFAPFWLVSRQLWLGLLGYVLLVAAAMGALYALDVGLAAMRMALLAIHLLIALEGDTIQRWTLDRKGWRNLGSIVAGSAEDAERRFFDAWLPTLPATAGGPARPSLSAAGPSRLASILGR